MKLDLAIYSCLLLIATMLGFLAGALTSKAVVRGEAIYAGVAEYQINKKTGASKFVFLTNQISINE